MGQLLLVCKLMLEGGSAILLALKHLLHLLSLRIELVKLVQSLVIFMIAQASLMVELAPLGEVSA